MPPNRGLWDPLTALGRERRAQGLADPGLGGPRLADGRRRAGGDFVGAGVERHHDGPVLIRLPALRCRPSLEL